MFVSRIAATPSIKQSKNPPNVLPHPCLRALLPSNASIKEENIINNPNVSKIFSERIVPSLPSYPILGGFSLQRNSHRVSKSIGIGPAKVRKFAFNLQ